MREERFAGITVRLTGREDRQGGGDGPLVVLMHGFGAPGTDLVGLWRVLDVPGNVRFAFPEAPPSQGSMAACNAVFTRNVTPGGLVILSGTPVNLEAWKGGMARKREVPVFQSHGLHDPLLSFQAAEQLRDEMREVGLTTEWVPFRGGHEIPMPVLEGLGRFLQALG
jgi:predicted esterase